MFRDQRSRHAFTLVELLVVIGIIAVLVAMLLPALNRARAQARIVECAARLRDIGVASQAYATENRGQLPPPRADCGPVATPTYDYQHHFSKIHDWPNSPIHPGGRPQPEIGANIGRLIYRKHLADRRMTHCPLAPDSSQDDRWFDANYAYNIHVKKVTIGGTRYNRVWWPKVAGFGKTPLGALLVSTGGGDVTRGIPKMDRALASDPLGSGGGGGINFERRAVTHIVGNWKTYNLLFIDGSVRSAKMKANITRDPMNSWERMTDMLGYAEAVINGTAAGPPANNYNLIPIDP